MIAVTAEPTQALVDAISLRLRSDAVLMAFVTGVFGQLPAAARTAYPYLVLGRRHSDREAGAMQLPGSRVTLQIDGWSAHKGPYEMAQILSRVSVLLERHDLAVVGFDLVSRSVTCELSDVFDEPDVDAPDASLYHGVQRWTAELHEVS